MPDPLADALVFVGKCVLGVYLVVAICGHAYERWRRWWR